jgi:radial spoke head protein 3
MFDRRVIRGNTYAAHPVPAAPPTERARSKPRSAPRRRIPGTPEPVEGRRHMDIQTEAYLEELADTVPEAEVMTQTDAFMDRPPTPLFIPMKIGVDVETQIENGDLFDFDFEVEPILEVLVGKTLEQGLMEVMEEEELAAMRAHQEHFEQIRNAELVATQRMEAAERRKAEERERRIAQEKQRIEREKATREKVAAQTFARGYTSGLLGNVFDKLYDSGFFYDPVQREIETDFVPWFEDQVVAECSSAAASRKCVDEIIKKAFTDAAAARAEAAANLQREVDEARARKAAEAEAKAAAAKAAAEERVALAQTALDIFMKVPEGEVPEGEPAPEAVVSQEQFEEARRTLKEVAATREKEEKEALEEEEAKNAHALRLLNLLLTPLEAAEGEEPAEPALTQEQLDEAKKALTPEPEPEPEAEGDAPAEGEGEAPAEGEAPPAEGEAPPAEGDAPAEEVEAAEGEAAKEPEPAFEPPSADVLKHLIEAGTVTDEKIVAALVTETPEPPADAILDQLLLNEILVDDQIAKALVAKQLEDESAEKEPEEEPAAEEPAA